MPPRTARMCREDFMTTLSQTLPAFSAASSLDHHAHSSDPDRVMARDGAISAADARRAAPARKKGRTEASRPCVGSIMSWPAITVREDTSLEDVAWLMLAHRIGGAPVLNEHGHLSGIVTESDFVGRERGVPFSAFRAPQVFGQWLPEDGLRRLYRAARTLKVRDVMSSPVVTIHDDASIPDLVRLMIRRNLRRVPVMRDGALVGMVTRHDILHLMADSPDRGEVT